ncbi:XRE family transcriptional regulator [Prauserella sp. PE36]|uniref:helix-turn-helix domain-containing protein n=1 Tax=Prauserella sp. PE36 TaxID=1504709 RepID=UPI000DE54A5C|nr:helix-turn-helix transcriptional regulator [Prauserella sp. PE36]RBM17627.1 XRE family transcriptional regulator [Prauserella sp. PE36]
MGESVSPLAAYRLAAGFTQESLAEQLSIDRGTIGRWERGTQAPQPWQRPDLATSLRISLAELDDILHRTKRQTGSRSATPTSNKAAPADVRRSQQEWLRVRNAPGVRGRELTELAAWLYPESQRAPGGHVLAGPGWLLEQPVPLESVRLVWSDGQRPTRPLGSLEHVLPLTDRGELYAGYSRAVRDLVRPRLLENRLSYRLLDLQSDHGLALSFGTTTFFEVFDVKQALAHEFKGAWLASNRSVPDWSALPLRAAIGDPFDPQRLLMSPGISTLTIRRDRSDGQHRFVLHERDGGKVADGGGLCHVMPAGEFQPSSVDLADVRNDFSLWRNIMREFSEEFLGNPEHDGSTSRPIDYANEEPFRSFDRARAEGGLRLWHYGLAMEPLELGAVQMTLAVVDDVVFDRLFADLVDTNDEGRVIGRGGRTDMPFTAEAIDRLGPRLSASALTLLRLGWRDREQLLDDRTTR